MSSFHLEDYAEDGDRRAPDVENGMRLVQRLFATINEHAGCIDELAGRLLELEDRVGRLEQRIRRRAA